jgi:periplasmic protein CpxP/Spy
MLRLPPLLAAALLAGGASLAAAESPSADRGNAPNAQRSAAGEPQPAAKTSRNSVSDETKKNAAKNDLGQPEKGTSGSSAEATPGRNSFTEGQARRRIEDSGFRDVTGLQQDRNGVWTGQATKDGKHVGVQLDFQGDVLTKP